MHGPHPRSHALQMNKKARKAALCSALSRRCEEKALTIFDDVQMDEIKTKNFKGIMSTFDFKDLLLIVPSYEGESEEERSTHNQKYDRVYRSGRNLPKVTVMSASGLNVYDILKHQNLAMTKDAAEQIASRLEK